MLRGNRGDLIKDTSGSEVTSSNAAHIPYSAGCFLGSMILYENNCRWIEAHNDLPIGARN